MAISPEYCRAAFLTFLDKWQAQLENLEADVEADDVRVDMDGQDMPAHNLFFWLRGDAEILREPYCDPVVELQGWNATPKTVPGG